MYTETHAHLRAGTQCASCVQHWSRSSLPALNFQASCQPSFYFHHLLHENYWSLGRRSMSPFLMKKGALSSFSHVGLSPFLFTLLSMLMWCKCISGATGCRLRVNASEFILLSILKHTSVCPPEFHPSSHSLIHPPIYTFIHPFTHPSLHWSMHPSMHPFIYFRPSAHQLIYPFSYPSIYPPMHPPCHNLWTRWERWES